MIPVKATEADPKKYASRTVDGWMDGGMDGWITMGHAPHEYNDWS